LSAAESGFVEVLPLSTATFTLEAAPCFGGSRIALRRRTSTPAFIHLFIHIQVDPKRLENLVDIEQVK
jgi:hypothetical protein